jgi:hypothetical protein
MPNALHDRRVDIRSKWRQVPSYFDLHRTQQKSKASAVVLMVRRRLGCVALAASVWPPSASNLNPVVPPAQGELEVSLTWARASVARAQGGVTLARGGELYADFTCLGMHVLRGENCSRASITTIITAHLPPSNRCTSGRVRSCLMECQQWKNLWM